jgi:NAD(P)-dependent dehydrogenase (short-subunit alcohol dehydrogenase family)
MLDLTGKTALVTGATGGIGQSIAEALHARGATVALSGTREGGSGGTGIFHGQPCPCAALQPDRS